MATWKWASWWRRMGVAVGMALSLWLGPALAKDGDLEVDVELVLAVDISYSMDPEEQALQRGGYIEALRSPEILAAIRKGVNGKIAVTYVEWAGSASQDVVADWTILDGPETIAEFTATLEKKPIRRLYRTSISGAIDFSVALFEKNNVHGLKRVIDISGDGSNNQGRPVTQARDEALAKGITINGLPIMLNRPSYGFQDIEQLDIYYTDCVIGGPGAFVIPIRERNQFIDAIRTKILLEVALSPTLLESGTRHASAPGRRGVEAGIGPLLPAQVTPPRVNCMYGERSWQQRWGN